MYRTVVIAIVTFGAISLPAETSLAFGGTRHFGPPSSSAAAPKADGVAATPLVKKLSPKAAGACYRACMHGMDSSWDGFCGHSCY